MPVVQKKVASDSSIEHASMNELSMLFRYLLQNLDEFLEQPNEFSKRKMQKTISELLMIIPSSASWSELRDTLSFAITMKEPFALRDITNLKMTVIRVMSEHGY